MHWKTRLVHPQAQAPAGFRSLATPTYRGSTVLFARQADAFDDWHQKERGYSYGLYGTPTVMELGARVAELENAHHTFIVPGGQAAIALVYLAYCRTGSHVLLPTTAYGPSRAMAEDLLQGLGVIAENYDPLIGQDISKIIRPETSLIWCESPGSITMEIQDVPAIVEVARSRGIAVALDNTYGAGVFFDAFRHGVDVSIQAATKYIGGHSDLLLGTVSVRDEHSYSTVGRAYGHLGMAASPDDCSLAIRGLQTMGLRLKHLEKSTLVIAQWLAKQEPIDIVLHPALSSCPGHAYWKRDFNGSASVFSVVLKERYGPDDAAAFVDSLKFFKIGFSWGGVTSLAIGFPDVHGPGGKYLGRLVRLNIGLEDPEDLIADLSRALGELP